MSYYVEKPGRFGVVKWDGQTASADEIVETLDEFINVTGHTYQILENGDLDVSSVPGEPGFMVTVPQGRTVVVGPKWGSAANPYLQFWMMTDAEVAERFNPAP